MLFEFGNIIVICCPIIIGIFCIAYPIMLDKISCIGEKYSSEYLSILFNGEFPQRKLFKRISVFQATIILSLFFCLPLIFRFTPLFGWDNWLINNSAHLLCLVFTIILIGVFIKWVNVIMLYIGSPKRLLKYLIERHKKQSNTQSQDYLLKTINEFALYSIEKDDKHLSEVLSEFYSKLFIAERDSSKKIEPLEYSDDLYEILYKIAKISTQLDSKRSSNFFYDAMRGSWLLGNSYEQNPPISIKTYYYLWIIAIYLIKNNHIDLFRSFWSTLNQYKDGENLKITYKENRMDENRLQEIDAYQEFCSAIGGYLLYQKQYDAIHYIFNYSNQSPPIIRLIPNTVGDILTMFVLLSDYDKSIYARAANIKDRYGMNYYFNLYLTLCLFRLFGNKDNRNQNFSKEIPNFSEEKLEVLNKKQEVISLLKSATEKLSVEIVKETLEIDMVFVQKDVENAINSIKSAIEDAIKKQEKNAVQPC